MVKLLVFVQTAAGVVLSQTPPWHVPQLVLHGVPSGTLATSAQFTAANAGVVTNPIPMHKNNVAKTINHFLVFMIIFSSFLF
jgi:hypothetical protein